MRLPNWIQATQRDYMFRKYVNSNNLWYLFNSLNAPRRVLRMFFFTLRPQYMQVTYTHDEPRLFWLREKPDDPKLSPMQGSKWCRVRYLWCTSVVISDINSNIQLYQLTSTNETKHLCVHIKTIYFISHLQDTVTTQWLDSDSVVTVDNCWQHNDCHWHLGHCAVGSC